MSTSKTIHKSKRVKSIYQGWSRSLSTGQKGHHTSSSRQSQAINAPFHLDNPCYLSRFLVNACDLDADDSVCVSEGWIGLRILDIVAFLRTSEAERQAQLTNYTKMQPKAGDIVQGDVYVFDDDVMAAVWEGVKFKRLPKRVVGIFLLPPKLT